MNNLRKIKKYAESLIKVSSKLNLDVNEITNNLILFKNLIREVPELRYLLQSKRIPLEVKKNAIKKTFDRYFGSIEIEFISMLLNDGEIGNITDIINKLDIIIQSDRNKQNIHVVASKQLDEEEKSNIIESIKNRYNIKSSDTSFSVDNKILGGIKIRIGNKIIDGSALTQLKKIRESLLSV